MARPFKSTTVEDRLLDKVHYISGPCTTMCWMFQGAKDKDGYGKIRVGNKRIRAHRLSFQLYHGNPGTMLVCHTCDNTACVNPEHLFLGTVLENNSDCAKKGRKKGYKLTVEQVKEIKNLLSEGFTHREIAKQFNVGKTTVGYFSKGHKWKHVT